MTQQNVEIVRAGMEASFRDGKIRVAEFFWDHADALDPLGLSHR